MTDARYPERWLNDRRIQQLSSDAFFAFVNALAWSVSNRTEGVIKFAELELIPRCKSAQADELTEAGLLKRRADGWLLTVYASTQSSRKQLENQDKYREREAERKAAKRAAERLVRADVRADVHADCIGEDRTGLETEPNYESANGQKNNGLESAPGNSADREYAEVFAAGADYEPPEYDEDGNPVDCGLTHEPPQ